MIFLCFVVATYYQILPISLGNEQNHSYKYPGGNATIWKKSQLID